VSKIKLEVLNKIKQKLEDDLQEFITFPSVEDLSVPPLGKGVADALEYIARKAEEDGFKVDRCDGYVTEITYGEGKETIAMVTHADVVPVGDLTKWNKPPFSKYKDQDYIYGRGSQDDKGPTIVSYYVLKYLKEIGYRPNRKIMLIVGGNEETGSRCLHHYFDVMHKPQPTYAFSPDAAFPLIHGEKGICNFLVSGEAPTSLVLKGGEAPNIVIDKVVGTLEGREIIEIGKAAHGSTPEEGINAVYKLFSKLEGKFYEEFIKAFDIDGSGFNINISGKELGKLTVNLGLIDIKEGKYNAIINIRYPETITASEIQERILSNKIVSNVKLLGDSHYLLVDKNSKFVKTLLKAYRDHTGDNSPSFTIGGGTYARHMTNAVAFGMNFKGDEELAHQANERILRKNLDKALKIYIDAILELDLL